jgi:hypothetical protein
VVEKERLFIRHFKCSAFHYLSVIQRKFLEKRTDAKTLVANGDMSGKREMKDAIERTEGKTMMGGESSATERSGEE